jgi:hypothetical protein
LCAPQALRRAYRIGSGAAPLRVYRLYLRNTLEERLLQLSDRMKGLEGLFKQGHARCGRGFAALDSRARGALIGAAGSRLMGPLHSRLAWLMGLSLSWPALHCSGPAQCMHSALADTSVAAVIVR